MVTEAACARSRAVVAATDLDAESVAVSRVEGRPFTLRWILLHMIEETARHNGHVDLIREAIDGATAFPLMAAAESWPTTPWMQPGEPS